jgi:hypothetical protein
MFQFLHKRDRNAARRASALRIINTAILQKSTSAILDLTFIFTVFLIPALFKGAA